VVSGGADEPRRVCGRDLRSGYTEGRNERGGLVAQAGGGSCHGVHQNEALRGEKVSTGDCGESSKRGYPGRNWGSAVGGFRWCLDGAVGHWSLDNFGSGVVATADLDSASNHGHCGKADRCDSASAEAGAGDLADLAGTCVGDALLRYLSM
jgi:hypothetical protein